MSADPVKETYLNECNELVQEMEYSLLQLESSPEDEDLINSIFRSAHTIKGTSGIFGYDDVVSFTHNVESVLDLLRGGGLSVDNTLIAVLLKSNDHTRELISNAINDENQTEKCLLDRSQELSIELNGFYGKVFCKKYIPLNTLNEKSCKNCEAFSDCDDVNKEDVAMSDEVDNGCVSIPDGDQVASSNWHISIRFSPYVLREGMDPLSFLRYLEKIGEVVAVNPVYESLPSLDDFDAECCYMGVEIDLKSDESKEKIESVFEFIIEESTVHILPPYAMISEYSKIIDSLPEDSMMIGEILVKSGALTKKELDDAVDLQTKQRSSNDPLASEKRIGDILVESKLIHKETVDDAVNKQKSIEKHSALRSIRVDADKLDTQINLVGELVIAGARSTLLAQQTSNENLIESISVIGRLVEEIRDSALRLRMVQIGDTFRKFQRVVRDVSTDLKKEIRLEISGADTELDKTIVEKIGDPLMHLVRNSMDHGIEPPEERVRLGKSPSGTLTLDAFHESGNVVIKVSDDGKGLDKDKIVSKAIEKGIIAESHNLSDHDVYQLIFEPGFSTAAEVSNLSGRGVGMDVVKRNITALRGNVDVETALGKGTTISITLPLTLAIIDGFLVGVNNSSYVIPLDMVVECIEVTEDNNLIRDNCDYINLRGDVLPYIRLRNMFGEPDGNNKRENIVVVKYGEMKAGVVVDSLMGEFQTVIKPLGKMFESLKGVSGSTILGSGDVAVILDVPGLINHVVQENGSSVKNRTEPQLLH